MAWTNEQLAAMQKNSGNLLLSAGAGSGRSEEHTSELQSL